ncbi:MAG TPA: hypothetical protein VJA40_02060 [archaeon]|nr:hypothetical protein [archaeon]
MPRTYFLTRPNHDDATHYLAQWIGETTKTAEENGLKVIELRGKKVKREDTEKILAKMHPDLVVFTGHGDENTVTGHDREPLIVAGKNEKLLKSKIVYAIACSSGKNLGPKSVEAGAKSYNGYAEPFIFFYEPEKVSRPLQDDTARLFLEPAQLFVKALLKGNSVKDARKKKQELLEKNINFLYSSSNPNVGIATFLWTNGEIFVSCGDQEATI